MAKKKTEPIEKLEREYVIPLRNKWKKVPRYKRVNKAIKAIKEFLVRHMGISGRDLNKVRLDKYLNEFVWARGIRKPPIKIKVRAIKEGDIVRAELFEMPEKMKFKQARLEKREKEAAEIEKKRKKEEKPEEKTEEKREEEKAPKTEEEKREEKEKAKAGEEAGKEQARKEAKRTKHQTKVSKQPKRQRRQALAK